MSQTRRPSPKQSKNASKSDPKTPPGPAPALRPLKPRKGLFAIACLIFAAWMAFLILLFFRTVYHRG